MGNQGLGRLDLFGYRQAAAGSIVAGAAAAAENTAAGA